MAAREINILVVREKNYWQSEKVKISTNKNNFKREKKLFRFRIKKSGENLCLIIPKFSLFTRFLVHVDSVDIYDYSKDFHLSLKSLLLCRKTKNFSCDWILNEEIFPLRSEDSLEISK